MAFPPLVHHASEDDYRKHFERVYCRRPVETFDGIKVRFRKGQFSHCFFESSRRDGNKDAFSPQRAERIDWIKATLQDPDAELYVGWDKARKRYDRSRRVALVQGNYVVVIRITGKAKADFVTAFVGDTPRPRGGKTSVEQIRGGPRWE